MARIDRWPNKRRNRYLKKVAVQHAEKLVAAIIKGQAQGDTRLGKIPLAVKRAALVDEVAQSIEQSIEKMRIRY